MKQKKRIIFGALSVTATTLVVLVACNKNIKDKADRGVSAGITAACEEPGSCGDSTISGVITSDILLQSCKEYHLSGLVYVANGAKITIEAGTRIEGDPGTPGTPGTPGGGLVITRGSQIIADGTETCPIVFTSYRWDSAPQSGDWAGVIILGNAPVNKTNPLIEGVPDNPPADANYGGDDCNDNSGILRYVRIEYAGYELSANNEINGLTFGGVGCGTTVEYVEVYKSKDDAFEFFGGTVNCKWLVAVDALDDMFDTDNGYVGFIQFALGVSDVTRADLSQSNGIESDNDAAGSGDDPETLPKISNMTIIGPGCDLASNTTMPPSGSGSYGRAAHIRRNSGFCISNSIFMGFKWGISVDGIASQNKLFVSGISNFRNNLVQACDTAFKLEGNPFGNWNAAAAGWGNTGYVSSDANADIKLNDPYNRFAQDFALPAENSPALGSTFNSICGSGGCCDFSFTSVNYKGAFSGSDNWALDILFGGWARFSN